ncbi:MAG: hypothetical protein OEU32_17000 [Acidimicrobiia bacterium]|nr:hypothetical protein [Acidimicrobiia bacterium]
MTDASVRIDRRRCRSIRVWRLLILALAATACSGGDSGGGTDAAAAAPTTIAEAPDNVEAEVRLVSQNILHGLTCPVDSARCALAERVALFFEQLDAAGCPELVSIQEANTQVVEIISDHVGACGYDIVWDDDPGLDREVVLTTLEVVGSRRLVLAGRFRSVHLVRVESPVGLIDFVTTHLASSDDGDCDPGVCPPPCEPGDSVRVCQARQIVDWVDGLAVDGGIIVLGGDLNATPGETPIGVISEAGFVDSHLAAGLGECNPTTGAGCTSGRGDDSLRDLTDPSSTQVRRIDYLFHLAIGRQCAVGDDTGLFNAEASPGELAFPSDHTGVQLTLVCRTTENDLAAAVDAPLPDDEPTVAADTGGAPDPATAAAITSAFETFFDGSADLELRAAQLEDSADLRGSFFDAFARAGGPAADTRARVDSISLTSGDTADVRYTVLVADQVVFDRLAGVAVRAESRWFVSRATYCDVAALVPAGDSESC